METTLKYTDPVYHGSIAPVEDQPLPTGSQAREPDTLLSAPIVTNGTTRLQSLLPPISHEYEKDGDRMQCWVCGNWYHA